MHTRIVGINNSQLCRYIDFIETQLLIINYRDVTCLLLILPLYACHPY